MRCDIRETKDPGHKRTEDVASIPLRPTNQKCGNITLPFELYLVAAHRGCPRPASNHRHPNGVSSSPENPSKHVLTGRCYRSAKGRWNMPARWRSTFC